MPVSCLPFFDFLFVFARADETDFRIGKSPHPMKPHRMRMVHDLILNYNMHKKLDMCVSPLLLLFIYRQTKFGFVDYQACELDGNDKISYRRVHCFLEEHYSRSTR